MKEIDNYMTVGEAAHHWNLPIETVKNKLKPSIKGVKEAIEMMDEEGLIKYSKHPDSKQGVWIITQQAMEKWFGKNN